MEDKAGDAVGQAATGDAAADDENGPDGDDRRAGEAGERFVDRDQAGDEQRASTEQGDDVGPQLLGDEECYGDDQQHENENLIRRHQSQARTDDRARR